MMKKRNLTSTELTLSKKVFKQSINYLKVKVHDGKYIFFQPGDSGMTPNGEIYIDGVYRADFALARGSLQAFFIHEMTHVWQYQNNILNPITSAIGEMIKHAFHYSDAYKYTLEESKDLLEYGMEQQAAIIEDYFRITFGGLAPAKGNLQNTYTEVKNNGLYGKVLANFIANPSYARHKVVCTRQKSGNPGQRRTVCKRVLVK